MPKTIKKAAAKKKPTPKRTPSGVRKLVLPKRRWYNPLTWRFTPPVEASKPLPKARKLLMTTLRQLWHHKRLFGGIVGVYGVLNILLVHGLSSGSDLTTIKSALDTLTTGFGGKVVSSLAGFGYLLVTSGSSGSAQNASMYQSILLLVCSLAVIWALRQVLAKHEARVRDSFYKGMYPLIPFILVFLMLGVQFLPAIVGAGLYEVMVSNGIAIHLWEKAILFIVFISLGLWSIRMVLASVFALYIVLLLDMTPMRALRSAKQLVYGRRLQILRKLIFLPVIMLLMAVVIELPIILFLTPIATWTFFVLGMAALPLVHGYLYNLYREML